jgi:hypothetical protein
MAAHTATACFRAAVSPCLPVVSIVGQVQLGPYEQHLLVQQYHTAVVHHTCETATKAGQETQHHEHRQHEPISALSSKCRQW